MTINYIYNPQGEIEYAVIPYSAWLRFESLFEKEESTEKQKQPFKPSKYRGILSHLNLDIEQELKEMREQWTRSF